MHFVDQSISAKYTRAKPIDATPHISPLSLSLSSALKVSGTGDDNKGGSDPWME